MNSACAGRDTQRRQIVRERWGERDGEREWEGEREVAENGTRDNG